MSDKVYCGRCAHYLEMKVGIVSASLCGAEENVVMKDTFEARIPEFRYPPYIQNGENDCPWFVPKEEKTTTPRWAQETDIGIHVDSYSSPVEWVAEVLKKENEGLDKR